MRIKSRLRGAVAPVVMVGLAMFGLASPSVSSASDDLTAVVIPDACTAVIPSRPAACDVAPETKFACGVVWDNYVPLIKSACQTTVATVNQTLAFLNAQGYVRATNPVQAQSCNTVLGTGIGDVTTCLTVVAEVLYSLRAWNSVLVCYAEMPGATTVAMKCGGTAGVAVIPMSIGTKAILWQGYGSESVTATASGPLGYDLTASLNISWGY